MNPTSNFLSICAVAAASVGMVLPGCATRRDATPKVLESIKNADAKDSPYFIFFAPRIPTIQNSNVATNPNLRVVFSKGADGKDRVFIQEFTLIADPDPVASLTRNVNFEVKTITDPALALQLLETANEYVQAQINIAASGNFKNRTVYITDGFQIDTLSRHDPNRQHGTYAWGGDAIPISEETMVNALTDLQSTYKRAYVIVGNGGLVVTQSLESQIDPAAIPNFVSPAAQDLMNQLDANTRTK